MTLAPDRAPGEAGPTPGAREPMDGAPPPAAFNFGARGKEAMAKPAARVFKVHIPLALHFELHRQRLLTGATVSATMEAALQAYLDRHVPEAA